MNNDLKRNIPLLYTIKSIRWFLMIMPTIVLFFQDNGLNMFQVMVVQGVFSVTMLLFEIPSGYFSDKIGRKVTIIIGLFFSTIGMYIFALAPNYSMFIIAEIFLGLGSSFISGTDTSMLYDSLLLLEKEGDYHKIDGRYASIGNYSESIASLLGGFIAVYSMKLNFFIEGTITGIAIIIALFLIEPDIKRVGRSSLKFRVFLQETKSIFKNHKTLYLVCFGALSGLGTFLALWYIQPEMADRGLPIAMFGLLWAMLNTIAGFSSSLSHKLPINKNPLNTLAIIPFLLALSYFVMIFLRGYWILVGFISFYIIRGLKGPLERNLIHQEISSHNRATVLSIQSMLMRLSFSISGPIFALLSNDGDNSAVYLAIGVLYMILGFINIHMKSVSSNGNQYDLL